MLKYKAISSRKWNTKHHILQTLTQFMCIILITLRAIISYYLIKTDILVKDLLKDFPSASYRNKLKRKNTINRWWHEIDINLHNTMMIHIPRQTEHHQPAHEKQQQLRHQLHRWQDPVGLCRSWSTSTIYRLTCTSETHPAPVWMQCKRLYGSWDRLCPHGEMRRRQQRNLPPVDSIKHLRYSLPSC